MMYFWYLGSDWTMPTRENAYRYKTFELFISFNMHLNARALSEDLEAPAPLPPPLL